MKRGSRKKAIKQFCIECVGGRDERGYTKEIANCTAVNCPLYPFRPYPVKKYDKKEDQLTT
jgi:hypothetical protein